MFLSLLAIRLCAVHNQAGTTCYLVRFTILTLGRYYRLGDHFYLLD